MRTRIVTVLIFILLFFLLQVASSADNDDLKKFIKKGGLIKLEETGDYFTIGAFYDTRDPWFLGDVNHFVSYFDSGVNPWEAAGGRNWAIRYKQAAERRFFTTESYYGVDSVDFVLYSGHGSNYYVNMLQEESGVNLRHCPGYGKRDLEFIVFQSCSVIPAPPDRADWYSAWWEHDGKGIFQGLHMALGYRSYAIVGGLGSYFAKRLVWGQPVLQSWFHANWELRSTTARKVYPGNPCVVFYPGLENDTLYNWGPDPPANAHWLAICWEEIELAEGETW